MLQQEGDELVHARPPQKSPGPRSDDAPVRSSMKINDPETSMATYRQNPLAIKLQLRGVVRPLHPAGERSRAGRMWEVVRIAAFTERKTQLKGTPRGRLS